MRPSRVASPLSSQTSSAPRGDTGGGGSINIILTDVRRVLANNRYGRAAAVRAVDAEGEVLDVLVQSKRNKHVALKLMRKLLKKYAFAPERWVIGLRSYAPSARDLGIEHLHERCRWKNHRPRIRISRPDGGSARCGAPRAPALRRNSSQPTPPCTTLSTSNAISRLLNHTACSAAAASAVGARDAPRADDNPERVAESYGPIAERLIKAKQS
jgi:hypothetical protein